MSAIKFSARIIASAAIALGLVASCGQLLGDYVVSVQENLPNLPAPDAAVVPEKICEVGVTECEGKVLRLCTDDGTAWAPLEVCASVDLCESSDVSTVSGCIPPTCAIDQMSCDGNTLRLCNVARKGWETFDTCESAAHCDAGAKQCLPVPCEPGDRRCNVGKLERCNDTRTGWEELDACETNELCEATLAPATTVGEVLSTDQVPAPEQVASDAQGPTECLKPVCVPKEVRCDEAVNPANLILCDEGQTGFSVAEDCQTSQLCQASITYTGQRGSPRCVRPTCAVGEHRCTETGGLEVCNVDRDGFDPIEQCIGAPFCNAVAADNGEPGCRDAPCAPGEQQCNGPQILVCSDDRTEFVSLVAPCETRGLCNDDNPQGAFCQPPVCQRGPFSGSEFRCEGASLLRCNDQHTGYDAINSCATPALCNASLGFAGCVNPTCAPGETRCNGNFVQRCNSDRTAFVNFEQCMPGTCDGTLGRCAEPCMLGSARCNAQGNLEECRDLLVGREITARCGSVQLCDAQGRTCRQPPAGCTADGVRRCRQQGQNSVLEVCTDGRSRFATLDTCTAGEFCDPGDQQCDVCQQGSEPVCEGNNLATCAANGQTESAQACEFGCQSVQNAADRCRNCVLGSTRCEGRQLVVCRSRNGTEVLDRDDCDTAALCQATLGSCSGENCSCRESECDPGERRCNGAQPEVCNDGQTGFRSDGSSCGQADNCDPSTGRCFPCNVFDVRCQNGTLFGCALDRRGFTIPIGPQRCVFDTGGDRSQTCNGSNPTPIDTRCSGGLPECVPGAGCKECDPRDFDPECAGLSSRRVCLEGDEQILACTGASSCLDAVCALGACNTSSRPLSDPCTRQGGNPGFCNGLQDNPSCVECTEPDHCEDDNECTTDSCSFDGACGHAARNGAACNGSAGVCEGTVCRPRRICDPGTFQCTGTLFQVCNAQGTAFVTQDTCASAALCGPSGCRTACDPKECDFGCDADQTACAPCNPNFCGGTDPTTCAIRECSGTQCIAEPQCEAALCVGGLCRECAGNLDCSGGQVCDSNTCVAPCNGLSCDFGCNLQTNTCNPCTPEGCGPVNPDVCTTRVCRGGTTCELVDRDGETCTNGNCVADQCIEAGSGGEDPGPVCGNLECEPPEDLLSCPLDCILPSAD